MIYDLRHTFSTPQPLTEAQKSALLSELTAALRRFGAVEDSGLLSLGELE